MKTIPAKHKVNWIPLPDPLSEDQVKLELTWKADNQTRQAIERQAKAMGFESPSAYLHQALAAVISGNEEDSVLTDDGRVVCGHDAYDEDGSPRNV